MSDPRASLSGELLATLENTAVELALLAGAEIAAAITRPFDIAYKAGAGIADDFRNPVSEIDRRAEQLIRARLGERFPEHDIIGEEMDERAGRGHDFVWAVDPIDGTANFINGFPLYAASVGLLYQGYPLAGAIWCASTHALKAGVYHGVWRGPLRFDGQVLPRRVNAGIRRHLAAAPAGGSTPHLPWDTRQTGSAAIEGAFTAAGLLRMTRLDDPNLWDVAGAVALVLASGGVVQTLREGRWVAFERFEGIPDVGAWRISLLMGDRQAVDVYVAQARE